jgi:hypothetical protein
MPGLVPGIHVFVIRGEKDVDGRAQASGSDAVPTTAMPASRSWFSRNDLKTWMPGTRPGMTKSGSAVTLMQPQCPSLSRPPTCFWV